MCFEALHAEEKERGREILCYRDWAAAEVTCPEATVRAGCGGKRNCCPGMAFRVEGCRDCVDVDLCSTGMSGLGRVIRMDATVRDVCPGKRMALAVILTEEGPCGEEWPRGMKTFTVPAHDGEGCRDVRLNCIEFVVPEDLEHRGCRCSSICSPRRFRARVIANYIDTDYECCCTQAVVL